MLEEIIREIVGDAAADTVSSLHPSAGTSTQPAEVHTPVTVAEVQPRPAGISTPPLTSEATAPPQGSSAAPAPPAASLAASATVPASLADPSLPEPAADSAEATGPPASAPPLPPQGLDTTDPDDVSRETSLPDGGTPLADQLMSETRRRIALEEAVLPLPETTRVFTISNQKGGVGKTTTAVNLAAALARAGAKVLVIDLDPQGNASTALGVDHRSEQQSVYEVLVHDLPIGPMIRPSAEHERLDCVPATIHLAGAEIELVSLVAREQRLRRALDTHLAEMEEPYHYIFIDCPPSLGLLTINAFVAAREVLIPIQCEYYALEGLSQLLSNIELIEKHLNPNLQLSTILLTMYDSRTNLAQQVAQEVREHFPEQTLGTIIPRSVRVSEAPSYGQSVISYDYGSSGSLSYREAAAEIARRGAPAVKENK
jgi:cellulose biosynthesis protein BcsQ